MLKTNVVEHNEFAEAQLKALNIAKDALINSFGPMGSNTMIIKENAFIPKMVILFFKTFNA